MTRDANLNVLCSLGPEASEVHGEVASEDRTNLLPSVFLPRDALVHSAVLRLHVVHPSVRL